MTFSEGESFIRARNATDRQRKRGRHCAMTTDTVNRSIALAPEQATLSTGSNDSLGATDFARYLIGTLLFRSPAKDSVDVTVTILRTIQADLIPQFGGSKLGLRAEHDPSHFISAVFRHSRVSYSVLLTGLLYMLRFRHYIAMRPLPCILPCAMSNVIMLVFVSSIMLSNKYLHDRHASNLTWSSYTGFPLEEINRGEIFFLNVIQHELLVDQSSFQKWLAILFQPRNISHYHRNVASSADHQLVPEAPLSRLAPPIPIESYRRPEQVFMGYIHAPSAQ